MQKETPGDERLKEVAKQLQHYQLNLVLQVQSYQQLQEALATRLNDLIANNFSLLISILYRLDISEKKLTQLLSVSSKTTAGEIIAEMIIERQLQKIASRKAFKNNPTDIDEEEKW